MKNYNELIKENLDWAKETFAKVDKKLSKMAIRSRDKVPDGVDENGFHVEKNRTWWTNGFWGGLNLMMYNYTKNEDYLKCAESNEKIMDEALRQVDVIHHDVGFQWHQLSVAHYNLTGDMDSRRRGLFAAATLSARYVMPDDHSIGFIKAWNGEGAYNWSIVDCLMNLPLLYWASRELKDDRFKRIAMSHADMAIRDHLRPDGSIVHIVEHSRETGECIKTHGGQGYGVGSTWSRGQAWGLYGFVISYIHTGEERYLNAAKSVANYFIANCCDDWLPRVDFRAPSEPVYYDSTAGACAACGMLELAKRLPEGEGGMYINAAVKILKAMTEAFCNFDPENDHMLDFGTVRYPVPGQFDEKQAGVHISIIYGDYFYTEALLKLLGSEFFTW